MFDECRTFRYADRVTDLFEPDVTDVSLATVMQALGDEARLAIVRELAAAGERTCGSFDIGVSKATRSHHFKVLREAGITRTRVEGTHKYVTLRRDDLDTRFPGLLDALLAARV